MIILDKVYIYNIDKVDNLYILSTFVENIYIEELVCPKNYKM